MEPLFIYVDVETLATADPTIRAAIASKHVVAPPDLDSITAAGNLKDPEKIAASIAERRQKALGDYEADVAKAAVDIDTEWRRTALDGATAHIACISWSVNDGEIDGVQSPILPSASEYSPEQIAAVLGNEAMLCDGEDAVLEVFFDSIDDAIIQRAQSLTKDDWQQLKRTGYDVLARADWTVKRDAMHRASIVPIIVAHHAQFDVRMIWQRARVLGVAVPEWWPVDCAPWDRNRVHDTMLMWAGSTGRISLDNLCTALGLVGKTGIDGSMVYDMVLAGKIDDVAGYCSDDVRRLRSCHRRLRGLEPLEIDYLALTQAHPDDDPTPENWTTVDAAVQAAEVWSRGVPDFDAAEAEAAS